MKGLEALKEVVRKYFIHNMDKEITIIEKELKALESIRVACKKYPELRATLGIACIDNLNLVLEVLDND